MVWSFAAATGARGVSWWAPGTIEVSALLDVLTPALKFAKLQNISVRVSTANGKGREGGREREGERERAGNNFNMSHGNSYRNLNPFVRTEYTLQQRRIPETCHSRLPSQQLVGDLNVLAGRCPELRELAVTGNGLIGNVVGLANCPSLVRLKLQECGGVTGNVATFATGFSRLAVLWLEGSGVTGDASTVRMALSKCDVRLGTEE